MSQSARPLTGGRIEGLDAWRALLMLGGLLLHATLWQRERPLFDVINLVSHSFRMGSFFAISGFLAGVSMLKRPSREWLARRYVQIGLPTAFGLLVICPLIGAIIRLHPADMRAPAPLPFDWYHLWFLVALLFYSPVAVLFGRLDRQHALVERFTVAFCTSRRTLLPLLLAVAVLCFLLMLAAGFLVGTFASPAYVATMNQWRLIAGYLPLYLFGFAMARSPDLQRVARRSWRSPLAVVAITATLYLCWYTLVKGLLPPEQQRCGEGLIQTIGAALCPPAVFLLIFRSAVGVRHTPVLLHRLCDASLTIYLVHLPVLTAINMLWWTTGGSPYLGYAISVLVGGAISYLIHVAVVKRSPLLLLLVNGRSGAPARCAPDTQPLVNEAGHHLAIGAADLHLSA